jgi:hypothetical protein
MSSPEDFESLRRLLALKRHEDPPPGYFHRFSDRILHRIEQQDAAEHSSWWRWFVARFDARPFWACAYGFTISSLLLMGFRLSQIFESEAAVAATPAGPWLAGMPAPSIPAPNHFLQARLAAASGLASFSSISPGVEVESRSLRFPQHGFVQPASFNFGGR